MTLGASGTYSDQPTVTYTPLTGNKYIKSLMTPLPPEAVLFTIMSGWPADGVLLVSVAEMNGLKNQSASLTGVTPPDPQFLRALALLRKIQISGAIAMRIKEDSEKHQATVIGFRTKDVSPETLADIHELRKLLRLDPDAEELNLVFGATAANDKEIAVQTRSIVQMMGIMAAQTDAPAEDVAQGRATPGCETPSNKVETVIQSRDAAGREVVPTNANATRLIQIRSSESEPADAFVSIRYRRHWFWIDDRDLKSKRTFSFMMVLFTLAETGDAAPLPLLTIPAR